MLIEPIKTGDFDFNIQWQYFDDFKTNPISIPKYSTASGSTKKTEPKVWSKTTNFKYLGLLKKWPWTTILKTRQRAKKVKVKLEDGSQSIKLSSTSFQRNLKSTQKLH